MERSANPVTQVLELLGESLQTRRYDGWDMHLPQGTFRCVSDAAGYREELSRFASPDGLREWDALRRRSSRHRRRFPCCT
jgi:hypothetical protein